MARRKKIKIGDVVEFPTDCGLVYLHVTHENRESPGYGFYSRVLHGFFPERPVNISGLPVNDERFGVFCMNLADFEVVGNLPIPVSKTEFPLVKWSNCDSPDPYAWWQLWRGKEYRLMSKLPRCAVNAALRELIDPDVLQSRLKAGWSPADIVLPENLDEGPFVWERYPTSLEFNQVMLQTNIYDFLKSRGV